MAEETGLVRREETNLAGAQSQSLMVSPEYIENTKRSLALLQDMVHTVLQRGRDYGTTPGISSEFLWDSGASTIISSFNCHPGHRRILTQVDDGKKIAFVVEVPIISNVTQQEVGSGIGAAQTEETKYKYRWVGNAADWGYSDDVIETLKTRKSGDRVEYRILNPEHDELLNTIIKQASKRAEVDAARSLPGVASALKDLMDGRRRESRSAGKSKQEDIDDNSPRWTAFWGQAKIILGKAASAKGIQVSELAHQTLEVSSMKDWLKKGKTLDDAIKVFSEEFGQEEEKPEKRKRDASKLKTIDAMLLACKEDFGLNEDTVLQELNVLFKDEIVDSPESCYLRISSVR